MIDKPELRRDLVNSDWVLVAPGRRRRPQQFAKSAKDVPVPKKDCPFEDPQKAGNGEALLWYTKSSEGSGQPPRDWALQVVKNKFPAVMRHAGRSCPVPLREGLYEKMAGVGFHEVLITRSHTRFLADMNTEEVERVVRAYQDRILWHKSEKCLEYIFVFHNHGRAAGASVWHPHSQIIALPIIPPDVRRSLSGAKLYWNEHKKCVHCEVVRQEITKKERIIYQNKGFVVLAPFASHTAFEVRIFPLKHQARFEDSNTESLKYFADALSGTLKKLKRALKNPAYNFFIHTAPIEGGDYSYYHWHVEILPKTSTFAGVELGTGVEVLAISPEEAAAYLRKVK